MPSLCSAWLVFNYNILWGVLFSGPAPCICMEMSSLNLKKFSSVILLKMLSVPSTQVVLFLQCLIVPYVPFTVGQSQSLSLSYSVHEWFSALLSSL